MHKLDSTASSVGTRSGKGPPLGDQSSQGESHAAKTAPAFNPMLARVTVLLNKLAAHPLVFVVGSALALFLVYLRTTAPTVMPGDAGEFQFAAWGFWLAHPTGYPLYLLLGGLWQHILPFGDPAFRLNLFSAFVSALAVGLSFLVFFRVSQNRGAALIAALAFGVSATFWSQATIAEVYALNTFFVVLLMYLALKARDVDSPHRDKYLAALAFTFGLSLAHHRTTLLLTPALAAWFAEPLANAIRGKQFAQLLPRAVILIILAALPLLFYLYIPLRAAASPYSTIHVTDTSSLVTFENDPRGWLGVVLGERFQNALAFDANSIARLRELPEQLIAELNPFGVALGVIGLGALLWRKRYSLAALLLFGFITYVLFNSVYHIGDIADLYTPAYFFLAMSLGAGVGAILTFLTEHIHFKNSTVPAIVLLGLLAVIPMQNLSTTFVDHDRSLRFETRTHWEQRLDSNLPQDAILVSNDRDEMTPLWYLQLVQKERPDLLGLFPLIAPGEQYANVLSLVDTVIDSGRPVYAIKPLPILNLRYRLQDEGNGMQRVVDAPLPPPQYESQVVVGDALAVVGFSVLRGTAARGESFTLGVQWHPLRPLERNYKTSVQLYDAEGQKVAQGNDHTPGEPDYPMSKWRVGRIIEDRFEMQINPNLEPGDYNVFVRVYDPETGDDLGEITEIGTLLVEE